MIKYDTNQYVEIFYKLPPEIKDVIVSTSTTEHLFKIGEKHSLHIDKIGIMTDLAFDVMMGIVASKNFVAELQKELEISALDASTLARDIDENVFRPIKNTMVSLYGDKAPNKPSSTMVTLTEDEEEHEHLDKDLLLREIESPAIAKPRVEEVKTEVKVEPKVEVPVPKATMEVEEYHEEISVGDKLPEVKVAPAPVELKIAAPDIASRSSLDRLADMKLSQAFVMPKNISSAQVVTPVAPVVPIQEKKESAPIQSAPVEAKKEPAPAPSAPKAYSADPYREPLS
ncbi:MAG: hypothetical protein WC761_04765 [Candidatus Paceibacterota bacterium]|jgi:hypothetical protein